MPVIFQRVAVTEKYRPIFEEKAKERPSLNSIKNPSPIGEQFKNVIVSKKIAKLANVGTGTLARYDVVMKSNNEATNFTFHKILLTLRQICQTPHFL